MKKSIYVVALSLLVSSFTYGQDYKKFKVGIGLGYALASGSGSSGCLLFALEPAYRLNDNFSLGLRMESALITRGFSESVPGVGLGVASVSSYTLNAQYYFGSSSFRPFVGAGVGTFSLAAVSLTGPIGTGTSTIPLTSESKIGFYPRVGFDLGHFNMCFDYNIIPATSAGGTDIKNSYMGIRIGAFFGGGKK